MHAVSNKCFFPSDAVDFLTTALAKVPNVRVFLNSAPIAVTRDPIRYSRHVLQLIVDVNSLPEASLDCFCIIFFNFVSALFLFFPLMVDIDCPHPPTHLPPPPPLCARITPHSGLITTVVVVQRHPTPEHASGWDRLLSDALPDWYSSADSAYFTKTVHTFALPAGGVVMDATEWGDVLVLADVPVAQGIELATENATDFDDHCGQPVTVCFYTSWGEAAAPQPDPTPRGSGGGYPLPHTVHVPWSKEYVGVGCIVFAPE